MAQKTKRPIELAIEAAGSGSALARDLGVTRQNVCIMKNSGRKLPAKHVPAISKMYGIPRWVLRPDMWEKPE